MNKARLIVTHLYRGVLGRNPDYQGLANFTNVIQQWGYNGLVGEVARGIGNSQEFSNRIGSTNSQVIVATLYDGIFLRQADPQGYQYWVNYVDAIRYGRATGEQLVRDFIETLEFQQMYF